MSKFQRVLTYFVCLSFVFVPFIIHSGFFSSSDISIGFPLYFLKTNVREIYTLNFLFDLILGILASSFIIRSFQVNSGTKYILSRALYHGIFLNVVGFNSLYIVYIFTSFGETATPNVNSAYALCFFFVIIVSFLWQTIYHKKVGLDRKEDSKKRYIFFTHILPFLISVYILFTVFSILIDHII